MLRVEALEVREEAAWGIRRPGYGDWVERVGELRIMQAADLVVPVSDVLDAQLEAAGIPKHRRFVLPNGVDIDAFRPGEPDGELRRASRLDGRFVIGWVGGFRPFHGLDLIPDLARRLRDQCPVAALCLIGTGPLHQRMVEETRELTDVVWILPPVPHEDVPRWLRSFDACLLLGDGDGFHYSPMKLYEYLSTGKPVIASRVGQVADVLDSARGEMLVDPGDVDGVVNRIKRLVADPALCAQLGAEGRRMVERKASWDARAEALVAVLVDRGLLGRTA